MTLSLILMFKTPVLNAGVSQIQNPDEGCTQIRATLELRGASSDRTCSEREEMENEENIEV